MYLLNFYFTCSDIQLFTVKRIFIACYEIKIISSNDQNEYHSLEKFYIVCKNTDLFNFSFDINVNKIREKGFIKLFQ